MFLFFFSLALIVQRIEHGIADPEMEVRFLLRAQGGCRGHGIVVITSGFQPEDRGSIPLARSEIYKQGEANRRRGREEVLSSSVGNYSKPWVLKERSDVRFPLPAHI